MSSINTPLRQILHIDLDAFFVSVERLLNSSLIGVPVIIGGGTEGHKGVVSACSYEARTFGVHSAMPIVVARRLCPHGVFIKSTPGMYSRYSGMVTEIMAEESPLFEKASVDEFYVDLSGMDRFHGCYKWSESLRLRIIKETGLPVSFGLSTNKTVAKMATDYCKPNGKLNVPATEIQTFLYPLMVDRIPGVGRQTGAELKELGIHTIGQLQAVPAHFLVKTFGKWGHYLWEKAHGIDDSPVESYREEKSMSREVTLSEDTTDPAVLRTLVTGMTDELAFELRVSGRLTGCVAIKLRYKDFETHTKQQVIAPSSNEQDILPIVRTLLQKIFTRRCGVRLVGVRFSALCTGAVQGELFRDTEPLLKLRSASDKIRLKYGKGVIGWAAGTKRKP